MSGVTVLLAAGATGYVLETAKEEELVRGIHATARGDKYYCRATGEQVRKLNAGPTDRKAMKIDDYSGVEQRIIAMLERGMSVSEMSNTLRVSIDAVKRHRLCILEKSGCKNFIDFMREAKEKGLLSE